MDNRSFIKDHKISFLFATVSALVVIFQTGRFWYLADLSYVLEHSYKIINGFTMYKDFIFPYPPGTFYIQAVIIKVFGSTLYPQIVYCSVISFLTYLLTYRILFFFNNDKLLNLILSLPVAFSGGYGIVSFPFYDPDSVFFMLLSVYFIFYGFERGFSPKKIIFLGGFFTVFPAFFKQNTGLVFLVLVHSAIIITLFFKRDEIKFKSYLVFLLGSLISLAGWVVYLQLTSGFGNYYYSVITIPREVRLPTPSRYTHDFFNLGVVRGVVLWISILFIVYSRKKSKAINIFQYLLVPVPFIIIPLFGVLVLRHEYFDSFLYIWPVTVIFAAAGGLYSILKIRGELFKKVFIFVLIGLVSAAFLSQGYNSSTYSLWPVLSVIFGILYFLLRNSNFEAVISQIKKIFIINSLGIAVSVAVLVVSNFHWHMVFYLSGDGELNRSANPRLEGLVAPGEFIPNLDNLLEFVKNEIPPGDAVETIPHEDPFFLATGRKPVLPYYINEWTLIIYKPEEIVNMINSSGIKWIVIKTKLQMGNTDINRNADYIISCVKTDFTLYKELPGYEIYKK